MLEVKKSYLQDLQKRLEQSQRDKVQLKKSIEQLNDCYQSKIEILQKTIQAYEDRLVEHLEWKKNYIDKELEVSAKYEEENKKLLDIIDGLQSAFNQEKKKMQEKIGQKGMIIKQYVEEREELINKSQQSQQKIDQLVREHTKQIEQLKSQLLLLKQQLIESNAEQIVNSKQIIVEPEQQTQEQNQNCQQSQSVLRQISNNNLTIKSQETRIKQITYRSPFVQFATH